MAYPGERFTSLIAAGYTMVYGVLRLINFAHGDVYMIGAMVGLCVALRGSFSAVGNDGLSPSVVLGSRPQRPRY